MGKEDNAKSIPKNQTIPSS